MNIYLLCVSTLLVLGSGLVSGYYQRYVECTYNKYRYNCEGRQLNMASRGLTDFPTTNGEQCLLLGSNDIQRFPNDLGRLQVVRSIDLSRNGFRQFPGDLSALKSLEHLDLTENQITSLPSSVAMPTSLRSLVLAGNKLASIPSGLRFPSIFVLDLSKNNFASIPPDFCVSNQFTRVDFTGNQLSSDTTMYMETLNKCPNMNKIPFCLFVDHREIKCDCDSLYPVLGTTPSFCLGTPLIGQPIICSPSNSSEEFMSKRLFDLNRQEVGKGCNFALRFKSTGNALTFTPVVMVTTIIGLIGFKFTQ